jgi:tetratricopeptide (TPR) repeat protein
MIRSLPSAPRHPALLALAAVVLLVGQLAAQTLGAAAEEDYLVWLHSLEASQAARQEAGRDEARPLFPFEVAALGTPATAADSTLADVAAALDELESRPRLLQEPRPLVPLHALGRARNYRTIAEFDSALVWYQEAARRDTDGTYAATLPSESLATAVATGDSLAVTRAVLDLVGSRELATRSRELELAYRFFVGRADSANLALLVEESRAQAALDSGRVAFWHAVALDQLGRWQDALEILTGLLAGDGVSHGLTERQRAWVLTAVPDHLVILGREDAAAPLYRALASSTLGEAALWARCQVAALDFLAGRFLEAGTAFEDLCGAKANARWRDYACGMATLSDEMERLRSEGEPHGAAALYER